VKFISIFLFLILFVVRSGATTAASASLEGMWRQECQHGVQRSEEFRGQFVRYTETFFVNAICAKPLFVFSASGPYKLFFHDIDFLFLEVTVSPLTQEIANDFNRRAVCGIRHWIVGQPSDIAGSMCDFFRLGVELPAPKRGQMKFGRWKLVGDRLYFGKGTPERDGSTPNRRALEWDPRSYRFTPR
jgi:hypothetical protein